MTRDEFIARFGRALDWNGALTESTALRGSDLWDSTSVLSAMMFIDEELGMSVSAAALQEVDTMQDVVDLVSERLS